MLMAVTEETGGAGKRRERLQDVHHEKAGKRELQSDAKALGGGVRTRLAGQMQAFE